MNNRTTWACAQGEQKTLDLYQRTDAVTSTARMVALRKVQDLPKLKLIVPDVHAEPATRTVLCA